ncbi:SAM-dependent methyltransferase [Pseudomonas oryzihabitans]|nr:SAM-dependent methyltransferase [Pseudomonas psychrotolerans]
MQADAFLDRFRALDLFLTEHQDLWRPRPFVELQLPWEATYPELAAWLRARSLADAEAVHTAPQTLAAPEPFASLAQAAWALTQVAELAEIVMPPPLERQDVAVPGRKWQQIEAFGSKLNFQRPVQRWVDWCAGKGHLARRLAQPDTPALCLEVDDALVSAGAQLSQKVRAPVSHQQADVLEPLSNVQLDTHDTPVALHACGDLHRQLLQVTAERECRQLALVPCCYDRIAAPLYRPLSDIARESPLLLEREDLRLALCETVTGGQRVRRDRDLSMARRLGFDLLQREVTQRDAYLNTPPLPVQWLRQPFAAFGQELARLKGLTLPRDIDWPHWEAQGFRRLAQVRNLELVRGLFRRPLELWLVLDQALFLQQHGYAVRLGTFCATDLTPRNLMLLAEKPTRT